jgi:hypothetical protein
MINCQTINRTLKRLVRKDTMLRFYEVNMAVPTVLYGGRIWVAKNKNASCIIQLVKYIRRYEH